MNKKIIFFLIVSGFYSTSSLMASLASPTSLAVLQSSLNALIVHLTELGNAFGPGGKITFATTPIHPGDITNLPSSIESQAQ